MTASRVRSHLGADASGQCQCCQRWRLYVGSTIAFIASAIARLCATEHCLSTHRIEVHFSRRVQLLPAVLSVVQMYWCPAWVKGIPFRRLRARVNCCCTDYHHVNMVGSVAIAHQGLDFLVVALLLQVELVFGVSESGLQITYLSCSSLSLRHDIHHALRQLYCLEACSGIHFHSH